MNIQERIEKLETKLAQARQQKRRKDAAERAASARRDRAADTRKKILVGAFFLGEMERAGIGAALLVFEEKRFADWLTRDDDRALFFSARENATTTDDYQERQLQLSQTEQEV